MNAIKSVKLIIRNRKLSRYLNDIWVFHFSVKHYNDIIVSHPRTPSVKYKFLYCEKNQKDSPLCSLHQTSWKMVERNRGGKK